MHWEQRLLDGQTRWKATLGTTPLIDGMAAEALQEAWRRYAKEVVGHADNCRGDVCHIGFHSEQGILALVPRGSSPEQSWPPFVIELKSDWLGDYAGTRIHSEMDMEEAIDQITEMESAIAEELIASARSVDLAALLECNPVKLCFGDPNDESSERTFDLFRES